SLLRMISFRSFASMKLRELRHVSEPQREHVLARSFREPVLRSERTGAARFDDLSVVVERDERPDALAVRALRASRELVPRLDRPAGDDPYVAGPENLPRRFCLRVALLRRLLGHRQGRARVEGLEEEI